MRTTPLSEYVSSVDSLRLLVQFVDSHHESTNKQNANSDPTSVLSVLLSLVVLNSEVFFSKILYSYLKHFPEFVREDLKVFSYSQLRQLDSIEAAQDQIIESTIDHIVGHGAWHWLIFLEWNAKISMGLVNAIRDELVEIYERRNVLVHHGGLVNASYISNVPARLRNGITVNTVLSIDTTYVRNAIDLFERAFLSIATELLRRIDP